MEAQSFMVKQTQKFLHQRWIVWILEKRYSNEKEEFIGVVRESNSDSLKLSKYLTIASLFALYLVIM